MNEYRCEMCEYYPAGSIFDERCPYSEFTWRHAGNHPQCIKDPFFASDIWQVPIDVMSELTSFIGCASHSEFICQGKKVMDVFVSLITSEMVYDDGDMYYKVNPEKYVEVLGRMVSDEPIPM